jgi:hypothetical protein
MQGGCGGDGAGRRPDPEHRTGATTVSRRRIGSELLLPILCIYSAIPFSASHSHETGKIRRMPAWSLPITKPTLPLRQRFQGCPSTGKSALSLGHRIALRSANSEQSHSGTPGTNVTPVQTSPQADTSGTARSPSHVVSPLWGDWTEVQVRCSPM